MANKTKARSRKEIIEVEVIKIAKRNDKTSDVS